MAQSWQGLRLWWQQGIRHKADIAPALQAVAAVMAAERYPAQDLFAVSLALEEALVNAVEHGHRNDPSKVVRLICWGSADEVVATAVDQGDSFSGGDVPEPLACNGWIAHLEVMVRRIGRKCSKDGTFGKVEPSKSMVW
jgi:anti-sigma regulatory factor (Ser/Thr protein kinase)